MLIEGLAGALIGFAGSAVESGLDLWKTYVNNKHEEKMASLGHEHRTKEYDQKAGDEEHARVLDHDKSLANDAYRSSVRPTITYIAFGLTIIISLSVLFGFIIVPEGTITDIITYIFALCNVVVGYWFGSRSRDKALAYMGLGARA